MYLKKIEIQGFKSFANKTEIKFKNDITAIVGPNGSGKSNISDAIRWVLGEQSIKSLRGSKMEDVIFSGTDKRRALGFAEVSIYFNNEDNTIPLDYNEVVVTRRVFRSGESEYYINKGPCRLKDIRTMFMDTGIGKDGYSIIGQGRIEEILSDKPEDRRNIFEEASEIVKYKSKKQESERRLSKTESNLDRIKDLIHEISSQERSLKNDSRKANDFVILYEELKTLEISLHTSEIIGLKDKIDKNMEYISQVTNNINDIDRERQTLKTNCEDIKNNISEKENKIESLREDKINIIKDLEAVKNQISLLKEKDNFSKLDLSRLEEENHKIKNRLLDLDEELNQNNMEKTKLIDEYNNLNNTYKIKKEDLDKINKEVSVGEEDLELKNKELIEIKNKAYENKIKFESLESLNSNSQEKISKLQEIIDEISNFIKDNNLKMKELEEDKKRLVELLEEDIKKNKDFLYQSHNMDEESKELEKRINDIQIKYENSISKYNLYKSMEDSYEGYYKGVKALLKSIEKSVDLQKGYIGIVADLFKVEKELETAVDIALGGSLQNFVVENETDGKRMIDYLKRNKLGRVTFLPLNSIRPNNLNNNFSKDIGVLGLGHELIEYDTSYANIFENLLGRTIIVDNINNGIKLANKYNHRYKIVTLEGEVLNPGGSLTGGNYKNNSLSIVSRKNRIEELELYSKELQGRKNDLDIQKSEIIRDMIVTKKNIEDIEIKINNKQEAIMDKDNSIIFYKNEIIIGNKELSKTKEELSSLIDDTKNFSIYKDKHERELEAFNKDLFELEEKLNAISQEISQKKGLKLSIEENSTELKININTLENNIKNLEEEFQRKSNEKDSLNISLSNIKEEIEILNSKMNNGDRDAVNLNSKIIELEKHHDFITSELDRNMKEREEIKIKYEEKQEQVEELKDQSQMLEKKRDSGSLNLEKWNFRIENYKEKLYDDYEIEYEENIEEDLNLDLKNFDIKAARDRITKLKARIKSLGNVNVAAIDEYKDVKERLDFLIKQNTDLINGKGDLENIIRDMEKKMKVQFMKSFKIINENFGETFSKLFNGGQASLELEEGQDILEAGIQIKVQPPGKKLQNLNLLSGGEKSLTAVALLFAILKSKPSPFCILDEIDAALDESNIARYTELLKEFNEETQFILITHRKTTMEIADILYGVTMEEDGISQLISVKLEDDIDGLAS